MDDLFRSERVLGTTTSPDIAAALIRDWLVSVVDRARQPPAETSR